MEINYSYEIPITLKRDINLFQNHIIHERGLSANTTESYMSDLKKFVHFMLRTLKKKEFNSIAPQDIEAYKTEISENLNLCTNSQIRNLATLRIFFKYLLSLGKVLKNPVGDIEMPKFEQSLPDVLEVDEIINIIEQPDTATITGIRDRAILELLYASGLKCSELIELKKNQVNTTSGILKILNKGKIDRIIPIGQNAVNWINQYKLLARATLATDANQQDYLFLTKKGVKMSRMAVWKIVKSCSDKVSLNKNVHPNTFRNSFASHLLKYGAELRDVNQLLGIADSSIPVTSKHLDREVLKDVYKTFHPRG